MAKEIKYESETLRKIFERINKKVDLAKKRVSNMTNYQINQKKEKRVINKDDKKYGAVYYFNKSKLDKDF